MTLFIHYNDLPVAADPEPAATAPVVWIPGETVGTHLVTVPPVSRKKWQAMIPWLLEERLLQPPDQLVFRSGDKGGDGRVPVVAVARDQLAAWRAELNHRNRRYSQLVPDFFALPWQEGEVSLAFVGERCLARFNRWQGAAGSPGLILPLVRAQLAAHPVDVAVYGEGEKPDMLDGLADFRFARVEKLFAPDHHHWLAVDDGDGANPSARWSLPARAAAVLVAVLVGLLAASAVVENRLLAEQTAHLQGQLRQGYRLYFGESYDFPMAEFQRVVSARLDARDQEDGGAIALTEKLAGVLRNCPDCRVEKLDISEGRVTASVAGEDVQARLSSAPGADRRLAIDGSGDNWRLTYAAEKR